MASTAKKISAGKTVSPASILEESTLKSLTGMDFQKNMALFRRSALKASAQ